jgi:hypothetical protein
LVVLELSCFLSVVLCGEVFTGWGFRVLEVFFLLFGFLLPSVAPAEKYSVWSAEGLPSMFGAGGRQAGGWEVAQQTGRQQPGGSAG